MSCCRAIILAISGVLLLSWLFGVIDSTQVATAQGGCPTHPPVYGRCLNRGYFTGAGSDTDPYPRRRPDGSTYTYNPIIFPLGNPYRYFEPWTGGSQWAFPSVRNAGTYTFSGRTINYPGGPSVRNPAYAKLFVAQTEDQLFANFGSGRCYDGAPYRPPPGQVEPAGFNPGANVGNLNYFVDKYAQPQGISTGSDCFNLRRNASGAATMVDTMMGKSGADFGSYQEGIAYAKSVFNEWRELVLYYDEQGWVNWAYQDVAPPGHLNTSAIRYGIDSIWFEWPGGGYNVRNIVFAGPGSEPYSINRSCANLIGAVEGLLAYNLTPTTGVSDTVAVSGQQVTFRHRVHNEGPSRSPSVDWQTRERIVDGSTGTLPEQANVGNPNSRGSVQNSGSTRYEKSTHRADDGSADGWYTETVTVSGEPGQKICRSLGLSPAGNDTANRYSAESCVLLAKRPTAHFMGADVSVGSPYRSDQADCATRSGTGGIYTIANDNNNGSAVEYASFTRGLIEFQQSLAHGFGTASQPGTSGNRVAQLGFANTDGDNVGAFDNGRCMPDYYAKYSAQLPAQASPGSRSFGGNERVHYQGDLTINASDIQNGADVLVVVDGDVTIMGDIRYSGSYGSTSEIPSFAVVAGGDIRVRDGVTQLDGVYSSKRNFDTCANAPARLSTNVCNQQLVINGALITDGLRLRRTFGANQPDLQQPAERFNYTTELFFNNVLADGGEGIETMEQRDLPPRY